MLDALLPYYERELASLRTLAAEFARRYPRIAGRLQLQGDQCEDPHVERLVEAFAFLTARIHRKLDDEYPEIAASFLDVLYPHYLRPVPSATIVQLSVDSHRPEVASRYCVERNESVDGPLIDGVPCRFRTCYPVDLYPLSVVAARLEPTSGSERLRRIAPDAAAVLTIEFATQGNIDLGRVGIDGLRLFVDGEPALAYPLHELLLTRCLRVRAGDGSDAPGRHTFLPAGALRAVGFERDEGLLEYDRRSFLGFRLLTEYFSFPEKFLFLDLVGVGAVASRLGGNQLVVECLLDRIPPGDRFSRLMERVQARHFRLGCTPVVNLFPHAAEPIRVTHERAAYPVWPDSRKPLGYEVIAIRKITRVERSGVEERSAEVPAFYAVGRADCGRGAGVFWHASRDRASRPNDAGTDVSLHLVDPDFTPLRPAAEVLSVELLCSNRDLPERIPFGGAQAKSGSAFSLPRHPVVKQVELLRKPTASRRPPLGRGLQWRLISHLVLNQLSIAQDGPAVLKDLLTLYNLSDAAAPARQIDGIRDLVSRPAVTRVAGRDFAGVVRGMELTLTLDDEHFVGASAYLFASVLDRLFALYCAPNSFSRLRLRSARLDEEVASWPARSSDAIVI